MDGQAVTSPAASGLGADAVALLQRLIRFNTVNPPGDERDAQVFCAELLPEAGFECELLARDPARPNLVARLRGAGAGPTLALLGHIDTVPADPAEWSRDPWSGDLHESEVWGRGALDMKDQVAAELAAAAALAREGWRPAGGELLVIITADEEMGASFGAKWLCSEHPDRVRADMVVNEGAGIRLELDGRRLYTLALGEKGVFRFNLRTRGRAGHASLPQVGDNALLKLAPLLERLRGQPPVEITEDGRAFLASLLGDSAADAPFEESLERLREASPLLAALLVGPMLGVTLTPTMARASEKENVVPSTAEVLVDCRVPPGMSEEAVRERVTGVLGEGDYEIEFIEGVVGNRSALQGPLAEAIEAWVAENDPGAEILPVTMPGFSDSHWWRRAFDATVFGFCPQRTMSLMEAVPLVHGADERVPVADVELGARFFYELPRRVLGSSDG